MYISKFQHAKLSHRECGIRKSTRHLKGTVNVIGAQASRVANSEKLLKMLMMVMKRVHLMSTKNICVQRNVRIAWARYALNDFLLPFA